MHETRRLAEWIVQHRPEQLPAAVIHEGKRALVNYLAATFGGCRHEAVEIALKTLLPFSGPPSARPIGRSERCDPLHATLINGISSHVDDFDDTLPKNYIHATSAVASALLAYGSANTVSGTAFLEALIVGFDVTSRVGNVVYPWHYEAGWHITSTSSVFGAAAAIGKVRRLDAERMTRALGVAATQSAGVRETFGSMAKAMHPGRAGQNGYFSALLAENAFTANPTGIEGARGFAIVQSSQHDLSRLLDGIGARYEIMENTYKPYPTGIVIQPTIDACIQIHRAERPDLAAIEAVDLEVAPIVFELCMKKDLKVGLEGKFSIYHAAAIGLVRGRASLEEFEDAVLEDKALARIREITVPRRNPKLADDEVIVHVRLRGGRVITKHVEHAVGNLERPMSDDEIADKFRDLARRVIAPAEAERLLDLCWRVETLGSLDELIACTAPQG